MNKLLPCPFCGSHDVDEELWVSTYEESGPGCDNCGATARTVESWNTRHTPEGWLMLHAAAVNALSEMPVAGESDKQDEARMELIDALAAAPKWGGE